MICTKRYVIALSLILLAIHLPAQNITGTWEGDLGNDQFLQLNIIQSGDKICGYTRDHVKADQRSFCKAFFEGTFDKQKMKLLISGKYFLQNTGGHTLMKLSLNYKIEKGVEVLEERPGAVSLLLSMMSAWGIFEADPFQAEASAQYVYIKKVSDEPFEILELMKDCIARDKKIIDTVAKVIVPEKPKDSLQAEVKIIGPEKPTDSIEPVITPVVKNKDRMTMPEEINQRKNTEQSHIEVNVKSINLKVYDNAITDGDTVSILYNGKLLLSHRLLSEKAIEINLELDENQTRHEIILFAENLGSIPPNTALVVITAGDKRYELYASASLQENAVLVFNYRPK